MNAGLKRTSFPPRSIDRVFKGTEWKNILKHFSSYGAREEIVKRMNAVYAFRGRNKTEGAVARKILG